MTAALLDRLVAASMPAPATRRAGGWLLRAAPAWDFRRTNSALAERADADLTELERFYAEQGLPARVRISSIDPPELDERLAAAGYAIGAPVDILVADSNQLRARLPERWPVRHARFGAADIPVDEPRMAAYVEMFDGSGLDAHFVAAVDGNVDIGRGIGVVAEGWVGIFAMRTPAEHRRRGAASAVLRGLAELAPQCYLQVETDNGPAQALYAHAGFTRSHGYHYRTR